MKGQGRDMMVVHILSFLNNQGFKKNSMINSVNSVNNSIYMSNSVYGNFPVDNCMFKVNNRNIRTRCEICSELTIKTPE